MEKPSFDGVLEGAEGSQEREECVGGEQVDNPPVALETKKDDGKVVDVDDNPVTPSPFAVFPHEVWAKIVSALKKDPEEAWNLIETYPELREEVINKREVLFYKVLPLVFPDLDKSSVLACRRVCQWWRTTVDQFLEDHPSQKPYQPETSFRNEAGYRYCALQDKNMEFMMKCLTSDFQDKVRVLETARETNVAPPSIVGKSASFFYDNSEALVDFRDYPADMMVYYNSLSNLLERIGSRIETVSLPLTGLIHILEDVAHYQGFVRCLGLLPNLKGLTVDTPYNRLFHNLNENGVRDENYAESRQQFVQLAQDFPLPELANLRSLKLHAELRLFHLYFPLQDINLHILRTYGNQLEKLCIDPCAVETCTEVGLANLTDLQIIRMENLCVDRTVQLLQNMDAQKLKKIEIYDSRFIPMGRIFAMLEEFQQLELFSIKMLKNFFASADEELPDFPNVKVLKLVIAEPPPWMGQRNPSHNPASRFPPMLPVLTAFPNLECLEIRLVDNIFEDHHYGGMGIYKRDVIGRKLLHCKVDMGREGEEREIWEMLPKLKKLNVGDKLFENCK